MGYDLDLTLVYGLFGVVNLKGVGPTERGYTINLGSNVKATEKLIIGMEYLHDSIDITGFDLDADTLTVRASSKF